MFWLLCLIMHSGPYRDTDPTCYQSTRDITDGASCGTGDSAGDILDCHTTATVMTWEVARVSYPVSAVLFAAGAVFDKDAAPFFIETVVVGRFT
jgi:hypothetical protein